MTIVQDGPAANLRKRKSLNPTTAAAGPAEGQEDIADGKTNAGGIASGESLAVLRTGGIPTEHGQEIDRQMDEHEEYEFGGPVGTTAMMVIFPVLMYYLWICLWYHQGSFVYPKNVDDIQPFMNRMWAHVLDGAYPTAFAWKSYLGLTVVQLLFAAFLPGIQQNGLPVPSLDYAALPYLCNALSSWYVTLITTGVLHYTGIYRLPWIIEHVGELMTVAIITSYACTLIIYWGAIFFNYGGRPIRMSGYFLYDVFMGASLNPRLGPVDLKMFAEVRVPWVLLFLLGLSGAVKQWEDTGRVTYNAAHYLLAIGLYMNACAKGEHYIPQTWDMFHEKFGWMLIFWNMAGVPFTYCYPVIYMMRAPSASYEFSLPVNIAMFLTLITCYIIFDGSMAQKSAFKLQQQGDFVPRGAFPQVPWSVVKNPTYVQTKHGNKLLTGGWWQFARKINYTSDWIQSVTWGLTGGLNTIITMWYPIFFLAVLVHRCERDFKKCSRKYGEDWDEYCRIVKYKFIPGIY